MPKLVSTCSNKTSVSLPIYAPYDINVSGPPTDVIRTFDHKGLVGGLSECQVEVAGLILLITTVLYHHACGRAQFRDPISVSLCSMTHFTVQYKHKGFNGNPNESHPSILIFENLLQVSGLP